MEIFFKDVTQSYGGVTLFKNLDLKIPSGEFFSLLGPSGSGKTTLLRLLAGFIRPDSGRILFGDRDVTRVPVHKRNTGIVFQDYALFPDRSVLANVCYGLRARGVGKREAESRALEMLTQVGLEGFGSRMPSELSGGQKQRVAMARALVIKPELLLLDEPLSALDVKLRLELRRLIRKLQQQSRITTVFVTHDQSEALAVSDRIAVVNHGRIVQMGTPSEIYTRPDCIFVSDFFGWSRLPVERELNASPSGLRRLKLKTAGIALTDGKRPFEAGMQLAFRPDHVRIAAPSGELKEGEVAAKVVSAEYRGGTVEYELDTADGMIRAEVPATGTVFASGDPVTATLPLNGRLVGEEP